MSSSSTETNELTTQLSQLKITRQKSTESQVPVTDIKWNGTETCGLCLMVYIYIYIYICLSAHSLTLFLLYHVNLSIYLIVQEFEENDAVIRLTECKGHYFHKDCELGTTIGQYIEQKKKCPVCGHFYGLALGDMPPGRMTVSKRSQVSKETLYNNPS